MENKTVGFNGIQPFFANIRYVDIGIDHPDYTVDDDHIHQECEIYINLSGDVDFMVENRIYPIKKGSVIITRPCEYHHCIIRSKELHRHFVIFFDGDKNQKLFPMFFDRPLGENNLIELSEKQLGKISELCFDFIGKKKSALGELSDFMRIFAIIENGENDSEAVFDSTPADIGAALEFIGENLGNHFSVYEVAKAAHISVNTLERRFLEVLKVTPSGYIKSRRLARAAELLPSCTSVSDVCEKCGFRDYSNFIAIFKNRFGVTPLKYKKLYGQKGLCAEMES